MDLWPEPLVGETADFPDGCVQKLEGILEQVDPPVIKHAAGGRAAGAPPVSGLGIPAHVALDAEDVADHPALPDQIHRLPDPAIPVPVVVGREHDV